MPWQQLLINVVPSSVLNGISPYEALYKKKFDASHLRIFGSLCFATNLQENDKLNPHSIPSIMLGYAAAQKGYWLLNIQNRAIFVSRDVIFKEHIFPSKWNELLSSTTILSMLMIGDMMRMKLSLIMMFNNIILSMLWSTIIGEWWSTSCWSHWTTYWSWTCAVISHVTCGSKMINQSFVCS